MQPTHINNNQKTKEKCCCSHYNSYIIVLHIASVILGLLFLAFAMNWSMLQFILPLYWDAWKHDPFLSLNSFFGSGIFIHHGSQCTVQLPTAPYRTVYIVNIHCWRLLSKCLMGKERTLVYVKLKFEFALQCTTYIIFLSAHTTITIDHDKYKHLFVWQRNALSI